MSSVSKYKVVSYFDSSVIYINNYHLNSKTQQLEILIKFVDNQV